MLPAIRHALATLSFAELQSVAALPGTARATIEALERVWSSDLDLKEMASAPGRLSDLAAIETHIRASLPGAWLLPRDLRDAALAKVANAPAIFGKVTLHGISDIDPVWRPLVVALSKVTPFSWNVVGNADRSWFPGNPDVAPPATPATEVAFSCADQRSEVVEALRWARQLLASGVAASDVAITSTMPQPYDETMLVLQRDSGLPIHFSHGIPALSTHEGQICASLADVMIRGIDQRRVHRLIRNLPLTPVSQLVPRDWAKGLGPEAGLFTLQQWGTALERSRHLRADGDKAEQAILPILRLLTGGPDNALQIGDTLLSGRSLALWRQALRVAPPAAVAMSLSKLRVPDDRDPANSIAWCSAQQLQASPRRYSRLLGLSVRSWPRSDRDDPLLPNHLVPRRSLQPRSVTERDRESFRIIRGSTEHIAYSFSRRGPRGGLQAASQLWPKALETELPRLRMPEHAFSENDRLLARSKDALVDERVVRSRACWSAWHRPELTEFDGLVRANDPVVARALGEPVTPGALRQLLRDPLAFVWSRALGWRASRMEPRPLELGQAAFGELVHEIIAMGVRALDTAGGIQKASNAERDEAIATAARSIEMDWPSRRAAPPGILWTGAVALAQALAQHALSVDEGLSQKVRSWTELAFGGLVIDQSSPWDQSVPVMIPGSNIKVHGRVDRFDLADSHATMRITDYKTFPLPQDEIMAVLSGGKELQRVVYAIAARELLSDVGRVAARLVYLQDGALERKLDGDDLSQAMDTVGHFSSVAAGELLAGRALPGPDAKDKYSRFRIALPADIEDYFAIKKTALDEAQSIMKPLWSMP